jgi:hypothetical protein
MLHTALNIALIRGFYVAIKFTVMKGRLNAVTIELHRGLKLAIIMDRHEGPQCSLTIAFRRGLYLTIIRTVIKRTTLPYSRLA